MAKFNTGSATVVAELGAGSNHFDIVAINPTKEFLVEKGIKVKEQPKTNYQWSVPFKMAPGTREIVVTDGQVEQLEKYAQRVMGESIYTNYKVNVLPKGTKLTSNLVQTVVVLEANGRYYLKYFKWFNEPDVPTWSYQKVEQPKWDSICKRVTMFDPQFKFTPMENGEFLEGQSSIYPKEAFRPLPTAHQKYTSSFNGVGGFSEFITMIKAYMKTVNQTMTLNNKEVSVFDPQVDLFATFGGQAFIDGDMSVVQELIADTAASKERKMRGFIGVLGISFSKFGEFLNKNQAIAEVYNKVVYDNKKNPKIEAISADQLEKKVLGMGVFVPQNITTFRPLSAQELNDLQALFYSKNKHLIPSGKKAKPAVAAPANTGGFDDVVDAAADSSWGAY